METTNTTQEDRCPSPSSDGGRHQWNLGLTFDSRTGERAVAVGCDWCHTRFEVPRQAVIDWLLEQRAKEGVQS